MRSYGFEAKRARMSNATKHARQMGKVWSMLQGVRPAAATPAEEQRQVHEGMWKCGVSCCVLNVMALRVVGIVGRVCKHS